MAAGIALSLVASYALTRLLDPAVNRLRDAIRGTKLRPVQRAAPDMAGTKTLLR